MSVSRNNKLTVGIGLTDQCNAACPHCYSRPKKTPSMLTKETVSNILQKLPIKSVNFGTGESIYHPDFAEIVEMFSTSGIASSVTTNGTTVKQLSDDVLKLFNDIDFSMDFPTKELNDNWRWHGAFDTVMNGISRCEKLGVQTSLTACLMNINHRHLGELARLAGDMGINLRINVYKSVNSEKFKPDYDEFWYAVAEMADNAYFTACSEPIVCAAIGMNNDNHVGSPCGHNSIRIHPDGSVVPCVYMKDSNVSIEKYIEYFLENGSFKKQSIITTPLPKMCMDCELKKICRGGCSARRFYNEHKAEEYCFIQRNDRPAINARWKTSKGLVHEDYLCTMIFSG